MSKRKSFAGVLARKRKIWKFLSAGYGGVIVELSDEFLDHVYWRSDRSFRGRMLGLNAIEIELENVMKGA